jgi:hypothetical protein
MGVGGARAFGVIGWLLVILQAPACSSDLVFEDGRYQPVRRHYSIAKPGGEGSAWRRVRVEGAEIAFQGPDRATMSLIEHCGRPLAKPRILARQLLIGLEGRALTDEGPLASDPTQGWVQWLDATAEGEVLRLKTVTRVIGPCSYDWILIVSDGLERQEPVFDEWMESFHSAAPEAGRGEDG